MGFEHVNKSPNDTREYRVITLENGLVALLVSDDYASSNIDVSSASEGTDKEATDFTDAEDEDDEETIDECFSAASLCIGIGGLCDPPDVPGLAHFLEHMVFMGSEKYPDENDFDKFVNTNGGNSNAATDCEKTVFHFDVQKKAFEETLDRFAQFFVAPLLNGDSVERELNVVDNEFNLLLTSDSARREQVIASLTKPGHPLGALLYGNKQTLQNSPALETKSAYARLPEFYKRHYSAQYMTLAVVSKDTLDNLEDLVTSIFSDIPNNGIPRPDFTHLSDPFDTPEFTMIYKVIPVKNVHQLVLTWELPTVLKHYKVKPLTYLEYLISHQGQGSLASYLRKQYWAMNVSSGPCGDGFDMNTICTVFHITLGLTDDGLAQVYEVLCAIFEYLNMLKEVGPQENIYREIQTIEDVNFRYQEQIDAAEYVENLSKCMQYLPPSDYITGDYLLEDYNEELIQQCMNCFNPRKTNIMLISKHYETLGICDQTEKYFGTKYASEEIPEDWLQAWETTKHRSIFHLPAPNAFIPIDFSLREKVKTVRNEYPMKINETDLSTLWYKQDHKFKVPKGFAKFELMSPLLSESPLAACMFDVFIKAVDHNLAETAYAAQAANFNYEVEGTATGFTIQVYGFNDTLPRLFEVIVDHIANFSICQELLDATVEQLRKSYHNDSIKPYNLAKYIRQQLLHERHWSPIERLAFLSSVSVEAVEAFVASMKRKMYVQGLIQGNLTEEAARWMEGMLLERIRCSPVPPGVLKELRVCRLPEGESYCRVRNMNLTDKNSVIVNYYQHGPATVRESVTNELLTMVMEEPLFDILRTQAQLGYNVFCSHRVDLGILGFSLTVCSQADKFSMEELDKHMEDFLLEFEDILKTMTNKSFKARKSGLLMVKQCDDVNLDVECIQNWGEIKNRTFMFDRLNREVKALEKLTKRDLLSWFRKHTSTNHTRKLSVQVVGNVTSSAGAIEMFPLGEGAFGEGAVGMAGTVGLTLDNKHDSQNHSTPRMEFLEVPLDGDTDDLHSIMNITTFRDSCYLYPVSKITL